MGEILEMGSCGAGTAVSEKANEPEASFCVP